MTIYVALKKCLAGRRVRPRCWSTFRPRHWVEARSHSIGTIFVEVGECEEMPHALRLELVREFLGPWEVFPGAGRRVGAEGEAT